MRCPRCEYNWNVSENPCPNCGLVLKLPDVLKRSRLVPMSPSQQKFSKEAPAAEHTIVPKREMDVQSSLKPRRLAPASPAEELQSFQSPVFPSPPAVNTPPVQPPSVVSSPTTNQVPDRLPRERAFERESQNLGLPDLDQPRRQERRGSPPAQRSGMAGQEWLHQQAMPAQEVPRRSRPLEPFAANAPVNVPPSRMQKRRMPGPEIAPAQPQSSLFSAGRAISVDELLPKMLSIPAESSVTPEQFLLPSPQELPPLPEKNDRLYALIWFVLTALCFLVPVVLSRFS